MGVIGLCLIFILCGVLALLAIWPILAMIFAIFAGVAAAILG